MCNNLSVNNVGSAAFDERFYWYALLTVKDASSAMISAFLNAYGSPGEAFSGRIGSSLITPAQKKALDEARNNIMQTYEDYSLLKSRGIKMILRGDSDYPERLCGIPDEPYGFFLMGSLPDPITPSVAIVGARRATSHGRWFARKLARDLAEKGVNVISGMAEGIDGSSHEGALEAKQGCGKTLAVLGSGIDVCFPKVNLGLYSKLCMSGGIISEYGPGSPGIPYRFPARNRIISAMADAVIVVEARERSGSLITVCRALEQGRDVMAVPGRPDDPCSQSCNRLLKEGAGVCTCADDVIDYLQIGGLIQHRQLTKKAAEKIISGGHLPEAFGPDDAPRFSDTPAEHVMASPSTGSISDPEKSLVLSKLSGEPLHVDIISKATGIDVTRLLPLLTSMELEGLITSVTGSMFRVN